MEKNDEFKTELLKAKEFQRVNNVLNNLTIIVVVFLIVVIIVQYFNNQKLKGRLTKEVYVTVEDKLYKAMPEVRTRNESDYKIFGEMFGYNAFAHDINSYRERMDIIKPFTTKVVMDYIEKSFEYKGLSITDYYKKYDGRSYFSIDSVKVEMKTGGGDVYVYGEQRFVFAIGEPIKGPLSYHLQVKDMKERSDANKFGLFVENFLFIR